MSAPNSLNVQRSTQGSPKVVVDFVLKEGGLYLIVMNASDDPVFEVGLKFDHPLKGIHGSQDLTKLPILRQLTYLAPAKRIQIFIDPIEVFFHFNKWGKLTIYIQYKGADKKVYKERNIYDLNIYRQLPPQTRVDFFQEEP